MKFYSVSLLLPLLASLSPSCAIESIHLSNCITTWTNGSGEVSSEIDYYADDSTSYDGLQPLSTNLCLTSISGLTDWEGTTVSCTFSTRVTVSTHIAADRADVATYAYARWVTNGFETFNCSRDDYRQLYSDNLGDGTTFCDSFYYCLPA